jgi:hypothetical protein
MMPEQRLDELAGVDWMVPAKHGTYLYQKKSQSGDAKLESVNYWTCRIPDLITRDGGDVANGLKSYETISGEEWDVVAGADHGQGAWRSYIKFFTKDTKWRCEQADTAKKQRSSDQIRNGDF